MSEVGRVVRPGDYGLPYPAFWPGQLEAIEGVKALFDGGAKVVMLLADTGTGKSGIARAISQSYRRATVLTKTISLEEQYGELLDQEIGRGRRWHECYYNNSNALKCMQDEQCSGVPCAYRLHIERLFSQKFRILNYAQFFALNMREQRFASDLVVCDEAHGLENALQSFVDLWYGKGEGDSIPTWGYEYKNVLFNNGQKFLLMSASMIPALVAETMGIEDFEVYEAENTFDSGSNPVFVKPVGHITAKHPLTERIISWIDNHLDTTSFNGVVHTASDRQTQEILDGTRYRGRFIWPRGKERGAAFKRFKEAGPGAGAVLISASSYEGQDFPDDECRWQIVCKVPYADLGSPHVRARREDRPEIYRLEALQRIQQACGRGMRHPDDWCSNYILDGNVVSLYNKYGHMLSRKFQQSWMGVM